ncbi:ead/Ea22-like family protein [Pseudomonas aeruginosa]|uniref:ead/Ea22-like family protein n=1 Tax=Pseudomonas aeruginosa TaxID=287 RepID=UPI0015F0936F|nr:ead/Ea22-like family protein [Pseudomonas aeruginosa]MBA5189783.1 ead/Ea22-like family protein [Pseudomonas aeruginosa]
MTDHAELRRLAKAATPGPWRVQTGCSWRRIGTDSGDGDVLRPCTHPHDGWPDIVAPAENLKYIASANPKTILALLDEIDRLKAENCAHKDTQKHCELLEQYLKECASALPGTYYMDPPDGGNVSIPEQIRRMAKDAARYRWRESETSKRSDKAAYSPG